MRLQKNETVEQTNDNVVPFLAIMGSKRRARYTMQKSTLYSS